MLSGLAYWLSPRRRRFMRRLGHPALARLRERLATAGSAAAIAFCATVLDANAEYLAFAISSPEGALTRFGGSAAPEQIEACLSATLIYCAAQFAREEMQRDDSQIIPLLARVTGFELTQVMLRRDQLRKAPRSEEWMLYGWLVAALGGERPVYDAALERAFSYGYLSYIDQYRPALERALGQLES
ncbi:MAG TPA: hypothetical protein VKR29_01200 [Candidatus Binataceae bacterium]|jgi:hypothetical protein|nr:hypothetical protein [Candidatus Binataceae bacterium]